MPRCEIRPFQARRDDSVSQDVVDLPGEWEDPDDPVQPPIPRKRWDFPRHGACIWPLGDVSKPDFHFCDEPIEPGRVYCPHHTDRAYVKLYTKKNAS